jgi:hypothetical protein
MKGKKMIRIVIRWGRAFYEKKEYYFDTEKERDAFLKGADEAIGWESMAILKMEEMPPLKSPTET